MLIDYQHVELRHSEQVVLSDISLQVEQGEFIYLLGKVGSGKSTLLKSLYAETPIHSGEAHIFNYDLKKIRRRDTPYLRRKIGIVFQDFQLLIDRNVEQNLLFVLKATGWKDKKAIDAQIQHVLNLVGMSNKGYKMPHQLSGGEQQRIVIARALLNTPEIILADEPTGNLDTNTGREVMELLYAIAQGGTAVLLATHNTQWTEQFPGRKLLFDNQHVIAQ